MRTLNLTDSNTFYAPASDECWVILAKEIMSSYALSYTHQICTTAFSQFDYDRIDKQKFAPQRKSILRRIKYGPLRNVVDMPSVFYAFEQQRKANLKSWGIKWEDKYTEDVESL